MPTITSVTKYFPSAVEGFTTTLNGTIAASATTVVLSSISGYTNGDTVVLIIDPTDATKKQAFTGVVDTAGVQITGVVWTEGSDQTHTTGATVVDYWTATHISMMTKGLLVAHDQTGVHKSGATYAAPVLSGTVTGTYTIGGTPTFPSSVATLTGTQTLTNKRVTERVVTATDDSTAIIDVDVTDQYQLTAMANATTISTTGTPTAGQKLVIRLKDNATPRALTWDAVFRAVGVTLPTTTVASKTHYIGCIYNLTDTKWDAVATVVEA